MLWKPLIVVRAVCIAALSPVIAAAGALTEQDAAMAALKDNPSIEILRISDTSGSLDLARKESGWLPQVNLNSTSSLSPNANRELKTDDGAAVAQALPGGGAASASIAYSGTHLSNPDSSSEGTTYSIGIAQPLLKDAWAFGEPGYSIKIEQLGRQQSKLQFKKDLASKISTIRTAYWSCYQAKIQLGISKNALALASDQFERERIRYSVGNAAPVDTLSALLQKLNAQQDLLNDEASYDNSLNELSRLLRMDKNSLILPDSSDIAISEMPPPEEFIQQAKEYDPQLKIDQAIKAKLMLQLQKSRNALLPSASLEAAYQYNTKASSNASLENNSVIKLILSYPLPNKSARIDRTQASLALRSNSLQEEDDQRDLQNRLEALVSNWKREKEKLAISRIALEVSQKNLDAATKGHELGTVDRLGLIQAQNDYVKQAVGLVQEQIALKILEISVDEATGVVFKRFGVLVQ